MKGFIHPCLVNAGLTDMGKPEFPSGWNRNGKWPYADLLIHPGQCWLAVLQGLWQRESPSQPCSMKASRKVPKSESDAFWCAKNVLHH